MEKRGANGERNVTQGWRLTGQTRRMENRCKLEGIGRIEKESTECRRESA